MAVMPLVGIRGMELMLQDMPTRPTSVSIPLTAGIRATRITAIELFSSLVNPSARRTRKAS
jgi:hypothetical protein